MVVPLVPFLILLLLWTALVATQAPPPGVVPRPLAVLRVPFVEPDYWSNLLATTLRLSTGFLLAAVTGVSLGLLAGAYRRVADVVSPFVTAISALPGIAWIPLAVAWLGPGSRAALFIIWNSSFFLIFSNTVTGVRVVPRALSEAVATLGGSRVHRLRTVLAPGALPYILAGLRTGLSFGWRAVITAELVGAAVGGMGQWAMIAQEFSRTDMIVAGALTIGAIGLAMDQLLLASFQRRTVGRWNDVGDGAAP